MSGIPGKSFSLDCGTNFRNQVLFVDYDALDRDRRLTAAMLDVRRKYGANAVFKGMNMLDGATTLERNRQIGGHKA